MSFGNYCAWQLTLWTISVTIKLFKHECNSQLSYPDCSRYHNNNLHGNLQVFLIYQVHYMTLIAKQDTLWKKSLLICMLSDKNQVVHPNISCQMYTFTVFFWSNWLYGFDRVINFSAESTLALVNIYISTYRP